MLGSHLAKIESDDLHRLLGISEPWMVDSVHVDEAEGILEVHLKNTDAMHRSLSDDMLVEGCWQHFTFGAYRTFIHAQVEKHNAAPISRQQLIEPAYLGHPSRTYSNFIRQQFSLGQLKGIEPTTLCDLYKIDKSTAKNIQHDLKEASSQVRMLSSLPTEIDRVWTNILLDNTQLETNVLPLKLLLSKLKSRASLIENRKELHPIIKALRKFFIENASVADIEIDQICGILSKPQKDRAHAVKAKQRLVLPSLKSPVWLDILSGRLSLNSLSVPLNLLIARQRSTFIKSETNREKIHAVETLRSYFHKNYRTLKPELVLINRAMNIRTKSTFNLPDPEHQVWQQILADDTFVPSENIAYKLLLAKLRGQIKLHADPVVKIEAARRIRDFIKQNKNSMRRELENVLNAAQ